MFDLVRVLPLILATVICAQARPNSHANSRRSSSAVSPFVISSPAFETILGSNPTLSVVFNRTLPLFHEAGIYHPPTDSMFVVSDTFSDPTITNGQEVQVLVHVTNLSTDKPQYTILNVTSLPNPTSGARYLHNGADLIAMVCIGSSATSGGLFFLNPYPPFNVTPLTTSYGPYPYNSPDDATVMPDGSIYFTDPVYGFTNGLRPPPYLPNQVYRYDPATNTTRAIVDGFGRPNGVTHSPDGTILYIGDTGADVGNGTIDTQGQRSTYAFSVRNLPSGVDGSTVGPFVTDRRVFAMPDVGANDGLKTDLHGNVWGQSTDGLHVWTPNGELLGKVLYADGDGGNLGFAEPGEVYLMAETVLYKLDISNTVVGTGVFT
ncbi:hypothetical protein LTR10_020265 [Elasticomyces elasticus]|uniref:SMP-30/Gluconolactonase/LRE-like region domain-containing protein n=1 Tax=Exophiala sideris TaxID=1016849 RepID=A0ABR0IV29_9EURO|nr:hypothetical protein LTR10_020265 [Elasticomyces elasticus]KAK5021285.1 hypothetical protein LTS07_011124 [Exophiala sideris]KAK5024244.1 hypothetical protein LTR13_010953 [Exophiala sideris]KAK5049186.1 hypothetical protein LTR69_011150 [Exophiala sideris]KAK5176497.1 hypothetical protein LTR44_010975 [Eurotiomycetes sp. CCFEE 6388]